MATVRFTVVMPLHDRVPLAPDAIRSALQQTLPPREVIVVDDGSVEEGVAALADLGPGVRVLRRPHEGVGAARNAGLRAATTEWIAFLDADDRWHPDHLEELARIVRSRPEAVLVSTDHVETRDAALPRTVAGPGRIRRRSYFPAAGRRIGVVWTSAAAVRRDVVLAAGGFGPWRHGEDLELWARLALHHPVAMSTARTARYVRGGGGAMEKLAAGRSASAPVRTHADVSPSCATVASALATGDHVVPAAQLRRYLDGRVLGLVRAAALARDRAAGDAAVRLLHSPRAPRALILRAALVMPGTAALVRRVRAALRALRLMLGR